MPAIPMGYSVRDFFLNGGSQAVIVRLFHAPFESEADRQAGEVAANAVANAVTGTEADAPAAKNAAVTKAGTFTKYPEQDAAKAVADAAESAAKVSGATATS